jgi:tetratricopeptide (TPR) repeat protein
LAVRCAALLVQDRLKEAEAAAGRLLARADFGVADVDIILPFLRKGGEEVGVPVLEGLRARSLASADHLARLAQLHESGGRLDRARQALEEAARSRPESIELLLGLARIAEQQKDHRGALGYLAHARSREPGNARVHFLFGMVCVELELGVEAHASLVEAVRLDPGNASYNYALGAVALHRRDPSEAISYFRKYVELRPDDPRGGFALGIAAYQARDFRAARAELRPAAERKETSAAAYHYLGRMAREENDLEEALRLSQGAVQANPAYADAWAELGLVRFRRRELALAEEALVKCLEQQPESYAGNLHLLMLYERTKDPRHDEQARKFERIKAAREEQAEDFRRVIEVRPP